MHTEVRRWPRGATCYGGAIPALVMVVAMVAGQLVWALAEAGRARVERRHLGCQFVGTVPASASVVAPGRKLLRDGP